MSRDHYVAGQPPEWSDRAMRFRHLDGSDADWRGAAPAAMPSRRPRGFRDGLRRMVRTVRAVLAFETTLLGPAGNKRDIAVFMVGCAWGVMVAIGAMAAWGIHP